MRFFLFGITFFLLSASLSSAQTTSGFEIIASQANPKPNTEVALEVRSFSFDINSSSIEWYVDGTLKKRGIGEKNFVVRVGSQGVPTKVSAIVTQNEGIQTTTSITLTPATVFLIWEAASYIPPFYKGKGLPTAGAEIKVTAFAQGTGNSFNPANFVYTWRQNGTILGSKSGVGKESISLLNKNPLAAHDISVDVKTLSGDTIGSASINIPIQNPKIVFYEVSQTEGVLFNSALSSSFQLPGNETTLIAYPYFFSSSNRINADLKLAWTAGGSPANPEETDTRKITLRRVGDSPGETTLTLSIQSTQHFLQSALRTLKISFGAENSV